MKRILLLLSLSAITFIGISQEAHTDQNGIRTSVVRNLMANATQAKRYEIAQVAMNSHHWQASGFMIVELFSVRPYTGYEKYKIQIGYGEGTHTTPKKLKILESHGSGHYAKVELGESYLAGTTYGGYDNMIVPIYVDVAYYSVYNVRMTYVYNKVDVLNSIGQIKIYDSPVGIDIANFVAPVVDHSDEDFAMKNGIVSGNLDVVGTIHATEIKVQAQTADFVFEEDYQLKSLEEVEQFVKTNNHLPDIPSAKEMKEDGVGLAEMNKLLLQKVEELTLYIIEMKKENVKQQKEIEKLIRDSK
ncbi:hypothetical protein [Labilibaculum euxinus]